MSETVKTALKMMMDSELTFKEWRTVVRDLRLNPADDVDGERFCAVMYTQWVYANMAALIGSGDDAALAEFIELVDSRGLIRRR